MVSFGVSRQAIKFPNEPWSWKSVKEIFLEPYFMVKLSLSERKSARSSIFRSIRSMVKFTLAQSIHLVSKVNLTLLNACHFIG